MSEQSKPHSPSDRCGSKIGFVTRHPTGIGESWTNFACSKPAGHTGGHEAVAGGYPRGQTDPVLTKIAWTRPALSAPSVSRGLTPQGRAGIDAADDDD